MTKELLRIKKSLPTIDRNKLTETISEKAFETLHYANDGIVKAIFESIARAESETQTGFIDDILSAFTGCTFSELIGEIETDDDERYYTPSATAGDYGPGCPWNAPGMSIRDFI